MVPKNVGVSSVSTQFCLKALCPHKALARPHPRRPKDPQFHACSSAPLDSTPPVPQGLFRSSVPIPPPGRLHLSLSSASQPPHSAPQVPEPRFTLVHPGPPPGCNPWLVSVPILLPGRPHVQVPAGLTCHPAAPRPASCSGPAPPTSRPGPPRALRRRNQVSRRAGLHFCCPLAVPRPAIAVRSF